MPNFAGQKWPKKQLCSFPLARCFVTEDDIGGKAGECQALISQVDEVSLLVPGDERGYASRLDEP